jgi:thioesterase domain-containing protein
MWPESPGAETYGREYVQRRISAEFPLARHIGIVVERADDAGVVLAAPLVANANHNGSAFGGSLFAVAVLTGWAWVTRYLEATHLTADAVIQESTIRYLLPVHGMLRATLAPPSAAHIERFRKMLLRARRGRICLRVNIHDERILATEFEGVFVAALR